MEWIVVMVVGLTAVALLVCGGLLLRLALRRHPMTYMGDAGRFPATMELHRDGDKVTGTWSGPLGQGRPVTGTWRDGYVELTIPVEWPKDAGQGAPGPVTVCLAGWIDGGSGKGRMRVEGRSDGVWTAKRKN